MSTRPNGRRFEVPASVKLALTGATGFVGAHLLDLALAEGHEVRALTRRAQPARDGVTWVDGAREPEHHAYIALASRHVVLVVELSPAPAPSA